jgi:hypothetical protein
MKFRAALCLSLAVVSLSVCEGATPLPGGDVNGDEKLNLADAVHLLAFLFAGGRDPAPCGPCQGGEDLPAPWTALRRASAGTADTNGDWKVIIADAVSLLAHLFAGGPAPVSCGRCWPYGPRQLPATGLSGCCWGYPEEGELEAQPVACDDPEWAGQDAQLHLGFAREERFVDNADGTISDRATGLMWQKETVVPEWTDENGPAVTYAVALQYAAELTLAGFDDWRIPNLFESWSVRKMECRGIDVGQSFPEPFPPAPTQDGFRPHFGRYFNSTDPKLFVQGNHVGSDGIGVDGVRLLRCVRAGTGPGETVLPATGAAHGWDPQGDPRGWGPRLPSTDLRVAGQDGQSQIGCPIEGRYVDNGDGTITDLCTGLMWQEAVAAVDGDDYGRATWQGALRYARDLDLAGYDDWRLPNVHESVFTLDWWYGGDPIVPWRGETTAYPFEFGMVSMAPRSYFWTASASERFWHRVVVVGYGAHGVHMAQNMGETWEDVWCRAFVRCVRGPIWIDEE